MHLYPYTIGALCLALGVYLWTIIATGRARVRYKVVAPAVTGDPAFERQYRVQMNTLEQMVLFLPLLVLAAYAWGDTWAAIYGTVWSIGRIWFGIAYVRDAGKRAPGFLLSGVLSMLVFVGILLTFLLKHF